MTRILKSKPVTDAIAADLAHRVERLKILGRGHILEPDFATALVYKKRGGWRGVSADGEVMEADIPKALPRPPFKKKKPFTEDGVELKAMEITWDIFAKKSLVGSVV